LGIASLLNGENKRFCGDHGVVKKSGDTLIKQFLRQQDGQLELRQFNPESTMELPLPDISSIYRIVGQWERG